LIPLAGNLDALFRRLMASPCSMPERKTSRRAPAQTNDLQAAQQLVLSNLRFVVHIALLHGYGLQLADLIQEGNIGLRRRSSGSTRKGVRLISFAVH